MWEDDKDDRAAAIVAWALLGGCFALGAVAATAVLWLVGGLQL